MDSILEVFHISELRDIIYKNLLIEEYTMIDLLLGLKMSNIQLSLLLIMLSDHIESIKGEEDESGSCSRCLRTCINRKICPRCQYLICNNCQILCPSNDYIDGYHSRHGCGDYFCIDCAKILPICNICNEKCCCIYNGKCSTHRYY
jgi:hypothetical protein